MKNSFLTRKSLPSILTKISLFSLSTIITLNTCVSLANTNLAKLNKWQFNPKTQQLEITLSQTTTPEYFYLDQPPRLVVDLPNTQLGKVDTQKDYTGSIQKIRVSQYSPNVTRIVIDLKPGNFVDVNQVKLQPLSAKNPTRWVLSPTISPYPSTNSTKAPSPNSLMTLPPPNTNLPTNLPTNQQPFVIVPPPNTQNPSSLPNSMIIPPNYPNPSGNTNMVTIPNSSVNVPNSQNYSDQNLDQNSTVPIIEFGQPLPTIK